LSLRARPLSQALVFALGIALCVLALQADRDWFELHTTRIYCATDAKAIQWFAIARWALGVGGVVACLLARKVGAWAGDRGAREMGWAVLRVVLAGTLALVVGDLVLRSTKLRRAPAPIPTCQLPPLEHDARLSWRYRGPNTVMLDDGGRPVEYAFDADGDRAPAPEHVTDPSRPTLLFAGESVTLGLGLTWEETYPSIVGDRLHMQIVNASVHGYGDDQIYLRMHDRLATLERPSAVITIAMAELLWRDVADWRDRLVLGQNGDLERVPAWPLFLRTSPLRRVLESMATLHDGEAVAVARAFLSATARDARARGAYPLVVLTNYGTNCVPDETGRPSIETRLFDGLSIDHVRVDLDPAWVISTNRHPDARAARAIADAVTLALRRAGVDGVVEP
jgi:hypothetical protein